jgi:hypothetical protein
LHAYSIDENARCCNEPELSTTQNLKSQDPAFQTTNGSMDL